MGSQSNGHDRVAATASASRVRWVAFGAIVLLLQIVPSRGQSAADDYRLQLDRLRRETLLQASPAVSPGQRSFFDYGAYFTFDYLSVDDNLNENHVLRNYDLVLYTRLNFDNAHDFFLRFRTTYQDFNDGDSFDGRGDELLDPDFDIAYYRFDLARSMAAYQGKEIDYNVVAQVGRDIVYWGNGLTLGQVIDGAIVDLSRGPLSLTLIGGITPVRTVDFDASRPDFDFNTRRGFYGAMASAQLGSSFRPFIYGLIQEDYNKDETLDLGTVSTEFHYDSHYVGIGATGNVGDHIAYGVEVVYEGGRTKSNSFTVSGPFLTPVEQTTDDINAFAADFRVDYLLLDPRSTRITNELLLATGDEDRLHTSDTFGGNAPNTTDRAFNAFGLLNTGLAFAPVASNLVMWRTGVSLFPFPDYRPLRRLQVGVDFFVYGKANDDAPIDEPTGDSPFLGWEPDFFLNWQIKSDVTLALRYGVFFPDSEAFADDDVRHFFSTSLTLAF